MARGSLRAVANTRSPVIAKLANERSRAAATGSMREVSQRKRQTAMLYTLAVVFAILWVLGLVTSNTMGGVIHVLLIFAVIAILLRVIGGRRVL